MLWVTFPLCIILAWASRLYLSVWPWSIGAIQNVFPNMIRNCFFCFLQQTGSSLTIWYGLPLLCITVLCIYSWLEPAYSIWASDLDPWQDPVYSWKAGPGVVMAVKNLFIIFSLTVCYGLPLLSIYSWLEPADSIWASDLDPLLPCIRQKVPNRLISVYMCMCCPIRIPSAYTLFVTSSKFLPAKSCSNKKQLMKYQIECIFLSKRRHYVTFHPQGIFGHHWSLLFNA